MRPRGARAGELSPAPAVAPARRQRLGIPLRSAWSMLAARVTPFPTKERLDMDAYANPTERTTRTLSTVDWIALVLLVVGGINWGLIGLFGFDLVASLFGEMSAFTRIVYTLVGIAAVYCIVAIPAARRVRAPAPQH